MLPASRQQALQEETAMLMGVVDRPGLMLSSSSRPGQTPRVVLLSWA